jgi:hypothetical protein
VPFVLLRGPGQVEVGCRVPEAQVRAAVQELCAESPHGAKPASG